MFQQTLCDQLDVWIYQVIGTWWFINEDQIDQTLKSYFLLASGYLHQWPADYQGHQNNSLTHPTAWIFFLVIRYLSEGHSKFDLISDIMPFGWIISDLTSNLVNEKENTFLFLLSVHTSPRCLPYITKKAFHLSFFWPLFTNKHLSKQTKAKVTPKAGTNMYNSFKYTPTVKSNNNMYKI